MSIAPEEFSRYLEHLKGEIFAQGKRVQDLLESAVEVLFNADAERARAVVEADREVDRFDVQIEREAVNLLSCPRELTAREVRETLTIVKVNNDLERIADSAVNVAEEVQSFISLPSLPPPTFRVMANSVIAMVRDSMQSLKTGDTDLAKLVLNADNAVDEFKSQILRDTEIQLASGVHTVDFAFSLIAIATDLERIADHATNICEQVIYQETGMIVRHGQSGWGDLTEVE
ncbi:MAG TPA: phosphate signaling complex protein PhoU [Phycisphaeraceae bacterium]|nr:phosphate signaling complex protein PhoU [Phycisphaeraceae bacterium]